MLFKKIIFDNYKTFYGNQEITFYIPEKVRKEEKKNIILIGGLNGSGKTTVLKAILYVLFGKRGISEEEHKKIFSNTINNTFFEEGGRDCSVTLIIETDRKEDWELKVKWSFDNKKRLIVENRSIKVLKHGLKHARHANIDNIHTYNRYIDKIIPYHAAPFFIFDGEEIKDIILRQNSSEMKDAIHKITGLDAYKELFNDLQSLKTDLEQKIAKAVNKSKLDKLNTELESIDIEIENIEKNAKKRKLKISKIESEITKYKKIRSEKLQINSNSREKIIKEQARISTLLKTKKDEFKKFYQENILYIILNEKILKLKKRLQVENNFKRQKIILESSLAPYRDFIEKLFKKPINPPLTQEQLNQIKKIGEEIWLDEKRLSFNSEAKIEVIHDISNNDYNYLINVKTPNKNSIIHIINAIDKLLLDYEQLEQEIRNAPESVDITEENNKIDELTKELGELSLRYKANLSKLKRLKDDKTSILNQITRISEQGADFEELNKQLQSINNLLRALNLFIENITQLKAEFIREEFATMLSKLFRKKEEFSIIEFDVETYTVRLYNDKKQEVSIHERSAGEMQMIASSLIWALTKASDLNLPMVIDTPLGRLDSYHRNQLINLYYKELSEQVIILSTDTEITKDYVEVMKENSYKQYELDYDQNKKYTIIRDNYFSFSKV